MTNLLYNKECKTILSQMMIKNSNIRDILLTYVENIINRVCEKQGSFKGKKNYKQMAVNNHKEKAKVLWMDKGGGVNFIS